MSEWRIWHRRPAHSEEGESDDIRSRQAWYRAFPIGNGRLGAMVFGGVRHERIQLNEISLWSGKRQDADNPEALQYLPEIRELLFQRRYAEAQALTYERLVCKGHGSGRGGGGNVEYGCYQTLGDLWFDFDVPDEAELSFYSHALDLKTATDTVSYNIGGIGMQRQAIVSAPDQVLAIRIGSVTTGALGFTARLDRIERAESAAHEPGTLTLSGQLNAGENDPNGMRFYAEARVLAGGGEMRVEGNSVVVSGANSAFILLSASTDYRDAADLNKPTLRVEAAAKKSFPWLRNDHVLDYRPLFERIRLTLPKTKGSDGMSIDERIAALKEGEADPGLAALYFQFGRYLLISSSRPGNLPANLQGVWADGVQTPWNADYHTNINVQMNYWHAETTSLPELHTPLFDLIESLREPGRKTARTHYGARGWVVHTITNPWGYTSPGEHPSWGQFPAAGGWLCLHLWEHYAFSKDEAFLARAYPVMKESAQFYIDFLTEEPETGYLVTAPSNSPENSFQTADGQRASVCFGPAMDTQIIWELLRRCVEASEILGVDEAFRSKARAVIDKLPPPAVGKHGQLQEWMEDFDEPEPGHRHISHLFALHPGSQISVRETPELAEACRVSLNRRLEHGGGHTGWSRAWVVNFWARLEDGEEAHRHVMELLRKSTLPNMFDTHPPFQIDGNFGGTAGIAEMLVQSHANEIALLPALPKAWDKGSVKGLRVRGGARMDIEWENCKAVRADLIAFRAHTHRVRPPKGQRIATAIAMEGSVEIGYQDGNAVVNVSAGAVVQFLFS